VGNDSASNRISSKPQKLQAILATVKIGRGNRRKVVQAGRKNSLPCRGPIVEKGKYSGGVARQYCGQLDRQGNCQAAFGQSLLLKLIVFDLIFRGGANASVRRTKGRDAG
jgi:hypothetical protein